MQTRIGIVFDEADSDKLSELSQYAETDVHSILTAAIKTLHKIMEDDVREEE